LQIKTKVVSCHVADSKPVKQEVNSTVILPPIVFPASTSSSVTAGERGGGGEGGGRRKLDPLRKEREREGERGIYCSLRNV
jgi:hypothetical protein